ncbi:MAG: glycosyltransferase family 87 protein [Phycisphaerae bacterium]
MRWTLPYNSPLPDGPRKRRCVRLLRVVLYGLVISAFVGTAVQFQYGLMRDIRKAERWDARHRDPTDQQLRKRPSGRSGAVTRWQLAVEQMWEGVDIYRSHDESSRSVSAQQGDGSRMHPNMPAVAVMMTPLTWVTPTTAAVVWNLMKLAVVAMAVLMAASVANHHDKRVPDWVVLLGLLLAGKFVISDIQHANTNVFVMGGIVAHLWLYRRGRDFAAGAPLALAICLKLTPVLFLAYWLYQRNWKLLTGALVALLVLGVLLPAVALGPERFADLSDSWWTNVISPGLVESQWYPIHINQSAPGVLARYLLGGQRAGNIYYAPDTRDPEPEANVWIAPVALSPEVARWVVRVVQAGIVLAGACAIGLRKLPREDGRRGLHYAIVLTAMMLLNQRTWDHHAAVMLGGSVALWYAVAYGRVGTVARKRSLMLVLVAMALVWATGKEAFVLAAKLFGHNGDTGELWHNLSQAYGLTFYHFLLVFLTAILLTVRLKKLDDPYASRRLRISE